MSTKRFQVALSFPGEKRDFVRQVADLLSASLGKDRILYDEYLTAELARPNLDVHLGDLYRLHSELLVPFYCADYHRKNWCKLEWRAMREIIHNLQDHQVMPFRFDDTPIEGVFSIDGYVKIAGHSPQEIADLILQRTQHPVSVVSGSHNGGRFIPRQPTKNPAFFFDSVEQLLFEQVGHYTLPEGAKAYLRLYPSNSVPPIDLETEAKDLAFKGNLWPMGGVNPNIFDRNEFGGIVAKSIREKQIHFFTQLFLTCEIWGVDAQCLNADCIITRYDHMPGPYIANHVVQDRFCTALQNFLRFSQIHLKLPPALKVEAGLVGIKGYPIQTSVFNILGKAFRDTLSWSCEVSSYEIPAWEILAPFFDLTWANCDLARPMQDQADLVSRFNQGRLSQLVAR